MKPAPQHTFIPSMALGGASQQLQTSLKSAHRAMPHQPWHWMGRAAAAHLPKTSSTAQCRTIYGVGWSRAVDASPPGAKATIAVPFMTMASMTKAERQTQVKTHCMHLVSYVLDSRRFSSVENLCCQVEFFAVLRERRAPRLPKANTCPSSPGSALAIPAWVAFLWRNSSKHSIKALR